jgi:hypothetical protein
LGLCPRDEIFHLHEAKKRKRLLLTRDVDFLNHRNFPFNKLNDTAIIILRSEDNQKSKLTFVYMIVNLIEEIEKSGNKNLNGLKIEIHGSKMILYSQIRGSTRKDRD